jgi:hypothetical protein
MVVLLSYMTVEVDPASGFDVPGQLPSLRCTVTGLSPCELGLRHPSDA